MTNELLSLDKLPIGEKGRVKKLLMNGSDRRRILDFGFVEGTKVEALQKSPFGNITAYFVRGMVIALRCEDSQKILIQL